MRPETAQQPEMESGRDAVLSVHVIVSRYQSQGVHVPIPNGYPKQRHDVAPSSLAPFPFAAYLRSVVCCAILFRVTVIGTLFKCCLSRNSSPMMGNTSPAPSPFLP
mmetsp:Transcript_14850/g.34327  ORF Transcript_14850/g.34327 Transcript_14850/m.34327 type:complete len:106 (+) Transcript_14850:903-1220(+)